MAEHIDKPCAVVLTTDKDSGLVEFATKFEPKPQTEFNECDPYLRSLNGLMLVVKANQLIDINKTPYCEPYYFVKVFDEELNREITIKLHYPPYKPEPTPKAKKSDNDFVAEADGLYD
jgi:hypothetical protein